MIIKDATELAKENYTEYGLYIAQGRSYPCVIDGLKASYRRALYGINENKSAKMLKVAELAAHALPYHPHPTSVAGVIIQMGENGNKFKLFDTQGNWGDSSKDVEASAERYISGKLSKIAEDLFLDSVEYCNFVKGEIDKDEPEALPALIPYCFINGMSGIPSGLPTLNIPTLDIIGMIDYYLEILNAKDINFKPKKYPKPNLEIDILSSKGEWDMILSTGKGAIKCSPVMSMEGNVITITALPKNRNADHVRKIIEKEILLEKLDIRDESTNDMCIVVEKVPHKQCDMKEIYKRLYNKLQANITYNMAFYDKDKIYVPCSFDKVVRSNLEYVISTHNNRIANELKDLEEKLAVLEIIERIKLKNYTKQFVELDYEGAVEFLCNTFKCSKVQASKVLQKPISYLTKEHKKEIEDLENAIAELKNDQSDIFEFLAKKYKDLKKKINSVIKNKFKPTKFVK